MAKVSEIFQMKLFYAVVSEVSYCGEVSVSDSPSELLSLIFRAPLTG